MDEDLGTDDLIGKTKVNLLPYFRHGHVDEWVKIFDPLKDWGDRDDMGEIRLIIDFRGPAGVRFPQRQDLVDTFDEKERTSYDDVVAKKLQKEAVEDKRRDEMRDHVRVSLRACVRACDRGGLVGWSLSIRSSSGSTTWAVGIDRCQQGGRGNEST